MWFIPAMGNFYKDTYGFSFELLYSEAWRLKQGWPLTDLLSDHWGNLKWLLTIPCTGWGIGRLVYWFRWEKPEK